MPVKLYITIDTEEDLWDKYRSNNNPVTNIDQIPKLQEIFNEFGAIPTYLINYPVVTNNHAKQILTQILNDCRCEIGMHCHPWNTPPFEEAINKRNSMMCNLPYDLVCKKLKTLHGKIKDFLGYRPLCFRAGRWGFNSFCAKAIRELGYTIDTSISPLMNWSSHFGPDFSDAIVTSYRFNADDILAENPNGILLEVPPTIGFLQKNFYFCRQIRHLILQSP